MKMIFICLAIVALIVGVCVVQANTNLLKIFKPDNTRLSTTTTSEEKKINFKNRSKKNVDPIDDDYYGNTISSKDVFIAVNGTTGRGVIQLNEITPETALSAYGTPLSQSTEFSDVDDEEVLKFHYDSGNIYFLHERLVGIDVVDKGIAVIVNKPDGSQVSFYSGVYTDVLYNTFTSSWENKIDDNVRIELKSPEGKKTDAAIVFQIAGSINNPTGSSITGFSILD